MGDTGEKKIKLRFYLLFVAVCVGLSLFNYFYNTKRFEDSQQQIIHAFEKSMKSCERNIPQNAHRQVESLSAANQKHQEEVKALLELQFNKIQNEYETQEVWTGILTIVFLIFSFYSLFKSEEMEKQGKIALHSIEESEKGAKTAFGSIETDKKKKLDEIKEEYTKWTAEESNRYAKIIEETQTKSTATIKSEIKKLTDKLESDYRKQATQHATTLKENSDKNIEDLRQQNSELITSFIKSLEEKNAEEIQKQVELWTSKLTELKKEYDKAINDLYADNTPVQAVEVVESQMQYDTSNNGTIEEALDDNSSVSIDSDDEELDDK